MEKVPHIYEIRQKVNFWLVVVILVAAILVIMPETYILLKNGQATSYDFLFGAITDIVAVTGLGTTAVIYSHVLLKMYERIDEALTQLKKTEAYKSAIMNSALDAILSIDSEGFVFECNPVAEKMFNFKIKDFLGKPFSQLFRWPFEREVVSPRLIHNIVKNMKPLPGVHFEVIAKRADGREFPAEVALTEVRVDQASFFTFFVRDITERKRTDEAKLKAIRARDEMLAVVSHELKNPLTAIGINLAMMRRAATPLFEENVRIQKYYDNIDLSVRRMSRLISDLLDAARIDSGQLKLEPSFVSVSELINEVIQIFHPFAEQKQIKLDAKLESRDVRVFCDKGRILQVLSNLMSNALKFTASGGSVLVQSESRGEYIQFQVKDNGPGISDESIPNIFNRYWQARQFSDQGTGLGLSIAKGIVDAHGGKIWVESKIDEGSAFYFTLPKKGASSSASEAVA